MKFITHHFLLALLGVVSGPFLLFGLNCLWKNRNFSGKFDRLLENMTFRVLLMSVFAIFVFWAYVLPTSYYHLRDDGVTGDNYCYMNNALSDNANHYYNPQHLSYPWLSGKVIQIARSFSILSKKDPLFLEKAFAMSTVPVRVLMILSFLCFIPALRVNALKWTDTFLGAFLIAAAGGSWFWGHQSNAMGMSIAIEIIASSMFLIWYRFFRLSYLMALGAALALCVYAQCASIYFVVPAYLFVTCVVMRSDRLNLKSKILNIFMFNGVIICLAVVFYRLAGLAVGNFSPPVIFRQVAAVADTANRVGFSVKPKMIFHSMKNNIVGSILNITYYWDPQTLLDCALITFQITVLCAWISALFLRPREFARKVIQGESLFFALISAFIFLGFLLRDAGSHYYTIATVPNAVLLILLLLRSNSPVQKTLLLLFLCSLVSYAGFSSCNVFEGGEINSSPAYRINQTIIQALSPDRKAVYYGRFDNKNSEFMDTITYRDNAIRSYYREKFSRIEWKNNPWSNPAELIVDLKISQKDKTKIFLNDEVLRTLQAFVPSVQVEHIGEGINLIASPV